MNQAIPPHSNGDDCSDPGFGRRISLRNLVAGGSIQRRLMVLVGSIVLLGLLTGVVIAFTAYRNERAAVIAQLSSTARAISSAVDLHIREHETLLKTLAASSELWETNFAAFHRLCAVVVTNEDTWVVLDDSSGQQLVNTRVPWGTNLPQEKCPPEEKAAFARGETFTSDLFVGKLTKLPVAFVGIPIRRPNGDYHLTIAMRPHVMSRALSLQELATNATITIADRKGTIIARNRGGEGVVGTLATPDMVRRVVEKREGVEDSVTKEGVPVFAAISRTQLSGWSVLIGVPKDECLASAHQLLALAGLLAAFLLAFVAAISFWIGNSLVRGVGELLRATESLSNGVPCAESATGIVETDYVSAALHRTSRDVAEREQQLAEATERLEEQVTIRTTELAETNRHLTLANRELENFAHVAAHDLREPLRTINGFTSSLIEDFQNELPKDARFYTDRIQNAAARMGRLLESIFAYSKVSAPKRAVKPVDLNTVLDEVLSDLEARLRETGARVIAGDLGLVLADHADLHQLLLNLLGNALKFRKDGVAPMVEVESGRVGHDIHLVVKDNGIGFDPSQAETIFAPFQRLHAEKRYEGTGMGLAIVRRIAERQGGSVYATSTPGVGSRFVVILRATEASHSTADHNEHSSRPSTTA